MCLLSGIEIFGGKHLQGEVKIHGSKNAVLPILAATVLNKGISVIKNCPDIADVFYMIKILEDMGCVISVEKSKITIDSSDIHCVEVTDECVRKMRSSIILLGAILGREKSVAISFPGGCSIGARPIDLHLKAIRKLNVQVKEEEGLIICETVKIKGNDIVLDFPSVGATENVMLTAVYGEGTTRIIGAAKEPEIKELAMFLNGMGAKISGAGTDTIIIEGVSDLHNVDYTLSSDRIVAGTYMAAVAGTGGSITLLGAECKNLYSVVMTIMDMGCTVTCKNDVITVDASERPKAVDILRTNPYPGFPTDMQSQIMAALTVAKGTSVIIENIFEARYKNVSELAKMGASIIAESKMAVVKGVEKLHGTEVYASDLRGGAGLVIAGLIAEGRTVINNVSYVMRGYEDICRDLNELGAVTKYLD